MCDQVCFIQHRIIHQVPSVVDIHISFFVTASQLHVMIIKIIFTMIPNNVIKHDQDLDKEQKIDGYMMD